MIGAMALLLAGGMMSCSGKIGEKGNDSDTAALDSIVAMVGDVTAADTANEQDQNLIIASVREIYQMRPENCYTPDFQKVLDAVDKKDAGEIGFIDYDILTNSQDSGEVKNVEILNLIAPDGAIVKVTGDMYGEKGYVIITVKLVDGSYLIDDIEGPGGKSTKQAAQAYVNGK